MDKFKFDDILLLVDIRCDLIYELQVNELLKWSDIEQGKQMRSIGASTRLFDVFFIYLQLVNDGVTKMRQITRHLLYKKRTKILFLSSRCKVI